MRKSNFGALCPHCDDGTMVASALFGGENRFFLFYITTEGTMCFDGICSNCQGQFQIKYSLMDLLFQCTDEEDEKNSSLREVLPIFKKLNVN